MNEWKELQIDNLPPDILTGDYEFQRWDRKPNGDLPNSFYPYECSRSGIIHLLEHNRDTFRYRKPEPKQPTHEEIMTKWWDCGSYWEKVESYCPSDETYNINDDWENTSWFIDSESATIPPEANK